MTRVARTIASEDQQLCEGCGYVLSGLPPGERCPECGRDAAESDPSLRRLPAWEDPTDSRPEGVRFFLTTLHVMVRPKSFYRSLATRHQGRAAYQFAAVHWAISALILGAAVYMHARWFNEFAGGPAHIGLLFWAIMVAVIYFVFDLTTAVAARLTHWEATYRGLRMPLPVVLRAMYYHAAHYLPVSVMALVTVVGYQYLLRSGSISPGTSAPMYLYVLCGEVIVAAFYLFQTYWTAMRNVMYANR